MRYTLKTLDKSSYTFLGSQPDFLLSTLIHNNTQTKAQLKNSLRTYENTLSHQNFEAFSEVIIYVSDAPIQCK